MKSIRQTIGIKCCKNTHKQAVTFENSNIPLEFFGKFSYVKVYLHVCMSYIDGSRAIAVSTVV